MKLRITELRDLVADAVRRTVSEARAKSRGKGIPSRTDESELARRSKATKGTGYSHADKSNFSRPLGHKNLYRRQGASNLGNYTAESRLRAMVDMIVAEEVRVRLAPPKR